MFARFLLFEEKCREHLRPPLLAPGRYQDPTFAMIQAAIESLDDTTRLVILANQENFFDANGASLGIGGGTPDGKYYCVAYIDGEEASVLDPSQPDEETEIMFGQPTFVSKQCLVPFNMAMEAARVFWDAGQLSSTLNWYHH